MPENLLQAKLCPPRVAERLVYRQSLIDRLNRHRSRPLTFISAPAGYGKSTLAWQWLQSGQEAFAWLSLDEYDRDLSDLVAYLIGALRTVLPDVGSRTIQAINSPQVPAAEWLSDLLLSELDGLTDPVYLVVDDYYTISNQECHRFMARFLQRMPANLHVVLLTRMDPPLPLSRLRGQGQLQEIRGADLRLSKDEATELLALIAPQPLPAQIVTLLAEVTEGWLFGLRMAALFLRDAEDLDAVARRFAAGGNRTITNYLLGEVLEHLPEERRVLLLRTAVSDRFCASLVDDLAADLLLESSSHEFLDWLWSSNFFLITLDNQGVWFRYHHLFRQLLDQELRRIYPPEELARLHQLAAHWFERNGEFEDGIIHMLHAGRADEAVRIVERHVHEPVNREAWRVVERWVGLLPLSARQSAGLLAIRAMLEQFRMRIDAMGALLVEAEATLAKSVYPPEERDLWLGLIYAIRCSGLIADNSPQDILSYTERATRLLDPSAAYAYSHAELWQIFALHMEDRTDEAIRLGQEKLATATGKVDARIMRLMLAHCGVCYYDLDPAGLRPAAASYLDTARRADATVSIGWARFLLGWCAYERNDLTTAGRYFSEAVDERMVMHMRAAIDSYTGLALTEQATGNTEKARATVDALRNFLLEQELTALLPIADGLALRIGSGTGSSYSVAGMAAKFDAQLAADFWELPALTAAWLEIVAGEPYGLAVAEDLLAACRAFAGSRRHKPQLLQIGILQSLLYETRGQRAQALDTLHQSILLAEPGGVLRYFVDFGHDLLPLLRNLAADGVAVQFIGRILEAYGPAAEPLLLSQGAGYARASSQMAVDLLSDLTKREVDVLILLGRRMTNKEIAGELHISPSTVKKHTINVYQKLGVNGRRQAAVRAGELGLL